MSGAREALYMALWDNYTPVEKNRFIAAFASELATADQSALQRVRAVLESEAVLGRSALEYRGLIIAALIDPEVSS